MLGRFYFKIFFFKYKKKELSKSVYLSKKAPIYGRYIRKSREILCACEGLYSCRHFLAKIKVRQEHLWNYEYKEHRFLDSHFSFTFSPSMRRLYTSSLSSTKDYVKQSFHNLNVSLKKMTLRCLQKYY